MSNTDIIKEKYKINNVYGLMKLLEIFKDNNTKRLMAKVQCIKCNKIKIMRASDLMNSKLNSCFCQITKHGDNRTKLYSIYANMKYRCYNPNMHEFHNYGGKGIIICDEWLGDNGYINFKKWAYENGYKDGLTIDRIDSNGNYCPQNCQWITRSENTIKSNKICQHRKSNNGIYYGINQYEEYYEFENASEFGREHNIDSAKIRYYAHKKDKKFVNGWKFGFIEEENN